MFGKLWLLFLLVQLGCARPRYEKVSLDLSGNNQASQKVRDCGHRFKTSNLCLLWEWEQRPTTSAAGVLIFKVVRANALDDSPLPVALSEQASVVLWMPSMNHGSTPTSVEQVDVGSYRVRDVFFIMPGQWEIRFQFSEGGLVKDEVFVPFTL